MKSNIIISDIIDVIRSEQTRLNIFGEDTTSTGETYYQMATVQLDTNFTYPCYVVNIHFGFNQLKVYSEKGIVSLGTSVRYINEQWDSIANAHLTINTTLVNVEQLDSVNNLMERVRSYWHGINTIQNYLNKS